MNNYSKFEKQLELLREEDFIWIIYFFIVIFAITSNHFERKYLYTNNSLDYKKFHSLNTTIFAIAFLIYLYFLIISIDELKTSDQNKITSFLRVVGAFLFLIAGAIYLYAEVHNYNLESDDIGLI